MMRGARVLAGALLFQALFAGALLLAAVSLQAADGQQGSRASDAQAGGESVAVSDLIGRGLVNARGESLGTISELVFDVRNGALLWVVTGSLAFPASGLRPQAGRYVLRGTDEARAFAHPEWPAMRASALVNREVVDRLHRDFGEIRDLLIDLDAQEVRAAVVDRRDDWAPGEALLALPIETFSLPPDLPEKVALNVSRERFE